MGKRFVPGILYKNVLDESKAFVIDARNLPFEQEHVLRLVHSVDNQGHVDYQSTLRVSRLNFNDHPDFKNGLKLLTRNLKKGNTTSSSVRNQHGDGYGMMYPLGTHMHNGKYTVYAKSATVTKEVLSALMPSYRKVLSKHIPFDLHAIDGHAQYHGMRPIELMGGNNGVTNSINVSRNLENPPHHDVGDLGNGILVWLEEYPGTATQWWFVCPNIIVKCPITGATKEGVIVRLCHGAMIDWDGLYTRHCTSVCERGDSKNTLLGVHLTNNHPSLKEFQAKLQLDNIQREAALEVEKQRNQQLAEQQQHIADNESQRSAHHDNYQECDPYHRRSGYVTYQETNQTREGGRGNNGRRDGRRELSRHQRSGRYSNHNMRSDNHHHYHHPY